MRQASGKHDAVLSKRAAAKPPSRDGQPRDTTSRVGMAEPWQAALATLLSLAGSGSLAVHPGVLFSSAFDQIMIMATLHLHCHSAHHNFSRQ